jgi:hypothetical protein
VPGNTLRALTLKEDVDMLFFLKSEGMFALACRLRCILKDITFVDKPTLAPYVPRGVCRNHNANDFRDAGCTMPRHRRTNLVTVICHRPQPRVLTVVHEAPPPANARPHA